MQKRTAIDPSRIPIHVGIIMDGNGRWASKRGKPRTSGHREGLKAAKKVVKAASDIGIRYLSLYTFSTENWERAESEVSFLLFLIRLHLKKELKFYRDNSIRVIHSGSLDRLPPEVVKEIVQVTNETSAYTGLTVNLAINYGGRDEIVRAAERLINTIDAQGITKNKDGITNNVRLTENELSKYMDHPELPDPDLIIRTGNELRVSNFLLWEGAYSELFFSSRLWPDWGRDDLLEAIIDYQNRKRRFGKVQQDE